jgi:hypothetical protein
VVIVGLAVAGCGDSGPRRVDVWGTVTWKGTPIPAGQVFFTPDVTKGNRGLQGVAVIQDGKFDTRFDKSRGLSSGPQQIEIRCFDAKGITRLMPYGHEMFAEHPQMEVEVPADGGEINLVVPNSAIPSNKARSDVLK